MDSGQNQARLLTLKEIYDNAGRPGASAFRFSVRRAGLQISEVEAKAFVANQASGQIFQGRIPSDGKIPAGAKDSSRAQADLIDFSKRISKLRGSKYVLIVVDLYDRQIFTVPQASKSAQETLNSWKRVIRANGGRTFGETTVDLGQEWAYLQREIENNGGVLRRKNLHAANTLGGVDAAISKLKRILSGYSLVDWADSLRRATSAYNEASHSALMGSAPDDVGTNKELQYEIEKQNGLDVATNNQKWRNKVGKLKDAGAFRIPRPRDTWERIDAPKFEGEVHTLPLTNAFKGANVEDAEGNSYPVKTSLAVPRGSADVDLGDTGPGQGRRAKQKEMLTDFARDLFALIRPDGFTLARVAQLLNSMRGFQDTTNVYGPARAGRIVNFLKLFPQQFRLEGSGARIKVFLSSQGGGATPYNSVPIAPQPQQPREFRRLRRMTDAPEP